MSHYIKLSISPRITDHIIGRNMTGGYIRDTLFNTTQVGGMRFGPNGLAIYRFKLISIDSSLENLKEILESDLDLNQFFVQKTAIDKTKEDQKAEPRINVDLTSVVELENDDQWGWFSWNRLKWGCFLVIAGALVLKFSPWFIKKVRSLITELTRRRMHPDREDQMIGLHIVRPRSK